LGGHLGLEAALEALRAGFGNGHLLSELVHVLCVAWYLQEADFEAADAALYAQAEQALERRAARAIQRNPTQGSRKKMAPLSCDSRAESQVQE
jgi:hypothetical protein